MLTQLKVLLLLPGFVDTAFFVFHLQYLTLSPEYILTSDGSESVNISREQFCAGSGEDFQIKWPYELTGWYGNRNIVCSIGFETLSNCLLGFMICAIIASLLVFVPLADIYGRKIVNLSLGAG